MLDCVEVSRRQKGKSSVVYRIISCPWGEYSGKQTEAVSAFSRIIHIVEHFVLFQILDDTYASQMQRLLGNALQEKDLEPPRSITEARSILSRDTTNRIDSSSYIYF